MPARRLCHVDERFLFFSLSDKRQVLVLDQISENPAVRLVGLEGEWRLVRSRNM